MATVYLAGPMVFLPDPMAMFAEMKEILSGLGLEGIAPIDNQLELEGKASGRELAAQIYAADEQIMREVDAAIFNISPFRRGTEMDAGTAFEVGYCRARGLPMTGWTTETRKYPDLVRDFMKTAYGEELVAAPPTGAGATSGALRDPDGILVHSDGLHQNLMIEMAIEAAGGRTFADPNWRQAFRMAASHLKEIVT